MKSFLLVVVGIIALSSASQAQEYNDEFAAVVDELLEVTGALKIGEQMSEVVVGQMFAAMKTVNKELPDRALTIVEEEVNETIEAEMNSKSFNKMMYPIYAKYLQKEDIKAALAFFETAEGKRFAEAQPLMMQEGMRVGMQWGAELGPKIGANVQERLKEEGIEMN